MDFDLKNILPEEFDGVLVVLIPYLTDSDTLEDIFNYCLSRSYGSIQGSPILVSPLVSGTMRSIWRALAVNPHTSSSVLSAIFAKYPSVADLMLSLAQNINLPLDLANRMLWSIIGNCASVDLWLEEESTIQKGYLKSTWVGIVRILQQRLGL
jgi:hypothetical protein